MAKSNNKAGTITERLDRDLYRDIGFLFIASCFVLVKLFGYTLEQAVLYSPLIILGLMTGIYLVIQVIWLVMRAWDRIADALHLKRSPLA